MKWLFVCLAVFFMVAPAMAGEDPYMAIVGNDCVPGVFNPFFGFTCPTTGTFGTVGASTPFYFSAKHQQFLYDQTVFGVPVCDPANGTLLPAYSGLTTRDPQSATAGCEQFRAQTPINQPEVCDVTGTGTTFPFTTRGRANAKVGAGNAGFYEWFIRLPKKPSGEINIVIQCGVLKGNAFAPNNFRAIELCAAETGERVCPNCTRCEVEPGVSPVIQAALPMITAIAYPGPFNSFTPFNLTAFKNPGTYALAFADCAGDPSCSMSNNTNSQVLNGTTATRVLLKACMDKSIVAKLPVTGQGNALSQLETDLEAGDLIYVKVNVPRQNSVDIYCHAQSVRLAGVGESPF